MNDNTQIVNKEEQALKDIRELILVNGSHDEWLANAITIIIEECLSAADNKEIDKLRDAWQEADALSRVYQGLARDAMAKYMAAIDNEPTTNNEEI